ncbi:carotenoid biosynthesis protein [Ligilactobacillus acidipiscis]|uniref:carotenoid biosynthesis protein n=1 Tax=Ligilactobacillus acidipiscis TaxID=89059 RepID=UPI0023F73880|nr:carotenoid biosynthesis protein [Ligilactobacillus acidipiscis]WEV57146.1 carotenoid biosynthesis protein [Ligilactobacillus acidipiscis]
MLHTQGNSPKTDFSKWLLLTLALFILCPLLLAPFTRNLPTGFATLITAGLLFLFLFVHAFSIMGAKAAGKMFLTGVIIAYVFEEFAIHMNIGGGYYFTALMGPKLDVVPLAIPLSWVGVLYIGWSMTNYLLDSAPTPRINTHPRIWLRAVVADLIITTIDLAGDPVSVANGLWVWKAGGPYFGVPVANYIGWFVIGTVTILLHGYQEKKQIHTAIDQAPRSLRLWTIAPLIIFAFITVSDVLSNFKGIFGTVQFFAMGGPCLLALIKWSDWYKITKSKGVTS